MKKVVCIVVMTMLGLGSLSAQDVKLGVKAGINFSNVSGDIENSDFKTGLNFGGFAEINLSSKFIFQPEILFSGQGASYKESYGTYSSEETIKLNYLNFPFMVKYALLDKFALEFGPQLGFLLSANANGTETNNGEILSHDINMKKYLKSIDFGLNFGASFDITKNILIGARYNLGLLNINEDLEDDENENIKIQNSVFSFSVGYRF